MKEKRLDVEMAARGLARSRSAAADLIKRGKVTVNGATVIKASLEVAENDQIALVGAESFVSRAGEKLAYALDSFSFDVKGLTVLDIGASTGGFTDCLLKRGAEKVITVDVGTGQLDQSLRADPRVEMHESTDIRKFLPAAPAAGAASSIDFATIDVSFISLEHILPAAFNLIKKGGLVIALVKPQFEVGKEIADRAKGIITDPAEQSVALDQVKTFAKKAGFKVTNETVSPITGEKGNKEFLLLLKKS